MKMNVTIARARQTGNQTMRIYFQTTYFPTSLTEDPAGPEPTAEADTDTTHKITQDGAPTIKGDIHHSHQRTIWRL